MLLTTDSLRLILTRMTTVTIVATVEYADGRVEFRRFRSDRLSPAALKRAIRLRLAKEEGIAHVGLGNYIAVNSYGAH
jgi:hypothetical protein